jgi:DNA-binding response OmpR family regulator
MPGGCRVTRSIVVAEDEPYLVEALTFVLRRAGFSVSVASDGPSAIELVRSRRPDLLLLDIMLPGCDGFEVLTKLRQDAALNDTRVVVLTAKGREQDRHRARELGADDYVTKPFDNMEVVERVRSLLTSA